MALTIYMEVHIPAAITDGLRRHGLDVLTSQEDQTRTAEDEDLLSRAASLGRLLFTYDEDFLTISAAWQRSGNTFPAFSLPRKGNEYRPSDCGGRRSGHLSAAEVILTQGGADWPWAGLCHTCRLVWPPAFSRVHVSKNVAYGM